MRRNSPILIVMVLVFGILTGVGLVAAAEGGLSPNARGEVTEASWSTAAVVPQINSDDATFLPATEPCVLFDTNPALLAPGSVTVFSTTGDLAGQGGDAGCSAPASSGALINLIAINPAATGNLKLWGAGLAEPNGGLVNFQKLTPALNNSNMVYTQVTPSGVAVKVNGGGVRVRAVYLGTFVPANSIASGYVQSAPPLPAWTSGSFPGINQLDSVTLSLPEPCSAPETATWTVAVRSTGTAGGLPGDIKVDVDIGIGVNSSTVISAGSLKSLTAEGTNPRLNWSSELVTTVASGSRTFYSLGANYDTTKVANVFEITTIAETKGFTCG